jgi:hypothetical protein
MLVAREAYHHDWADDSTISLPIDPHEHRHAMGHLVRSR